MNDPIPYRDVALVKKDDSPLPLKISLSTKPLKINVITRSHEEKEKKNNAENIRRDNGLDEAKNGGVPFGVTLFWRPLSGSSKNISRVFTSKAGGDDEGNQARRRQNAKGTYGILR